MILTTKDEFETHLFIDEITGAYHSKYDELLLQSVFQPILNSSKETIGYEALLRIHDANMQPIRPDLFFQDAKRSLHQILNVERLSRIIHIRNFAQLSQENTQLFLNVLPESAIHFHQHKLENINMSLLEARIKELNLMPQQVTLELLEFHYHDEERLAMAIQDIKNHGFNVAIDDFGCGASCEKRVSSLQPHIIKVDRKLLLQYDKGVTKPLLSAVNLAKKENAKIVIEGIETTSQYEKMKALGVDYFQGFLIGKPLPLHQQNHQAA
ncbi:EAL domain-containing protein [Aliivibrio sp. S3MY1]|uniref:EAL domain-containing protein n=1 Tax=unclassified Aliivibrio TaxID=2645654 RepID=UPI0023790740|nr:MULTISPECIES: EAL domain-containing protein [unclassified Aliivibrio]MDD9197140.1 EAL domain-containing protein [Aliivibrio sp. S3MY1]MDD9200015.1 EAL domain-containing protein [Aliivibrio sp. S2MY1]